MKSHHVCVYVFLNYPPFTMKMINEDKSLEKSQFKNFIKSQSTSNDIKKCIKNIHEMISIDINQYQSINQSINHEVIR